MAKMNKRWAVLVLALMFSVSLLAIPANAKGNSDNETGSQTHIYGEPGSKTDFSKEDITVTIGDNDYAFNNSGNNSWKNGTEIGELNIPDEGEGNSINVVITDSKGNVYDASLVNHSDQNGNNGNAKPGTDTYDLINIIKREPTTPDPVDLTPDPDPVDPTPDPVDPTPDPDPVDPTPDPDPVDPTPDPDPVDPTPDPEPENPPYVPAFYDDDYPIYEGNTLIIPDESVPLANVPATGDASLVWAAISGLSAAGMFLVNRKREDEE